MLSKQRSANWQGMNKQDLPSLLFVRFQLANVLLLSALPNNEGIYCFFLPLSLQAHFRLPFASVLLQLNVQCSPGYKSKRKQSVTANEFQQEQSTSIA